ncbi:VIT1/CCC1 transporter family protein [Candidatus Protochlamydia phocaeensis]|uniref:VIT1/CCC1 transporter family protein n=1 Tax=Candidatus Protochlamydia phocaeensis TaxID=1414722 RepID=UPI0008385279|nr:VIT1/CCC1 transporter family protein [Candidatus Protochlamydia phocaeensis]
MKTIYHKEDHFQAGNSISWHVRWTHCAFCSRWGIFGAVAETHLVITAGFAEIAAGSIAMDLGSYLAVKSDTKYFESEAKRENSPKLSTKLRQKNRKYRIYLPNTVFPKMNHHLW